jgi:hypothetical protein
MLLSSQSSYCHNALGLTNVCVISGLSSAITGILIMSRTMSAAYENGSTPYELLRVIFTINDFTRIRRQQESHRLYRATHLHGASYLILSGGEIHG